MSRTDTLQWVADLSLTKADQTTASQLYDEVVVDLAAEPMRLWFGNFTLTAAALDEELKFVPDDLVKIKAVFYNDHMLSWETKRAMESLDSTWRNRRHTPIAYVTDDVANDMIRLWPPSDIQCDELGWLYTQRVTDAPSIMDLPMAMLVLAREYERESDHRDMGFAGICRALGNAMLDMLSTS